MSTDNREQKKIHINDIIEKICRKWEQKKGSNDKIQIFESQQIRTAWHDDKKNVIFQLRMLWQF